MMDTQEDYDYSLGPLGLDYFALQSIIGATWVSAPIFLCWTAALIAFLTYTADNYFSPTLATMCEILNFSPEVAGATLLALGNGTPDVFTFVAAATRGDSDDILIGLGALLGAVGFIISMVVGAVVLCTKGLEVRVSSLSFSRDVTFLVVGIVLLSWCAFKGEIDIWDSIAFLLLYSMYIYAIFWIDRVNRIHRAKEEPELLDVSSALEAYWFRSPTSDCSATNDNMGSVMALINDNNETSHHRRSESGVERFSSTVHPDYFQHSDSTESALEIDSSDSVGAGQIPPEQAAFMQGSFMGYLSEGAVLKRHLAQLNNTPEDLSTRLEPFHLESHFTTEDRRRNCHHDDEQDRGATFRNVTTRAYNSLYWHQWKLRRQARRDLALLFDLFKGSTWKSKLLIIVKLPITTGLNATIMPPAEADGWNQTQAIVASALTLPFLAFVTGIFLKPIVPGVPIPVWALVVPFGLGLSVVVALTTHSQRPPKSKVYKVVLGMAAFASCIAWAYLVASEAVAVLKVIGRITKIPGSVLGLTVMAWGNSMMDIVSDIAVARSGYPGMAIAGCLGGPVFNIFVGVGISILPHISLPPGFSFFPYFRPMLFLNQKNFPAGVPFSLDYATFSTGCYLLVALAFMVITVASAKFRFNSKIAYGLIGLYASYCIIQLVILGIVK